MYKKTTNFINEIENQKSIELNKFAMIILVSVNLRKNQIE